MLTLTTLPTDVIGMILAKCDIKTSLILSSTCRMFRNLSDKLPSCELFSIAHLHGYTEMEDLKKIPARYARFIAFESAEYEMDDASSLSGLYRVNIANTCVSDISMLGNVHELNISGIDLEGADLFILRNVHTLYLDECHGVYKVNYLTHVVNLYLRWTSVSDVSSLGHLEILDISCTEVSDVSALGNLINLFASETPVTDVSMLGKLHTLDVSITEVEDVSALSNVNTLLINQSNVSDVSALTNVYHLNISETDVTDVNMLTNLVELYAANTSIDNVSNLINIRILDIENTNVTDVSKLVNIEELNITGTEVSDVSMLSKLKLLVCRGMYNVNIGAFDKCYMHIE